MDTGLGGKGVLVTGGAGGIGSAVVRAFAEEGARVAVHYHRSEDNARALAAEVAGVALRADLTAEADVDALVPEAVKALGRLDVLVANAGVWPAPDEPVWSMSLARWRQTLAENLDSVFLCCRAFLRHVESTGTGNIVLIASTAGLFGEAGHADYAAAKGALASGFLKSLKNEIARIAPQGRVNTVCPGWTAVPRNQDKLGDTAFVHRVTRTMPLRKLGRPEDVARTVVSLASDRVSGHVTGEVITVAGGMEGRVLNEA
ncbi:SDR family NAD(P)-dependent oxidoreductase [Archangium primigenium]|uniref:SDR family NAD(P)-dependent oxidoreductase n=1 Tax=[Archangium] primigenium TaxID=2792470 RepID=UPI00195A1DC7|nr:SDR family NAD(P)-dependent oxidoreductase [Archangium primigenium]MBM7115835.1 SDR family oxidoreductase [Archangium primigenium]